MPAQKKKYDVGILGWWYGKNYGSILTYYGLNRAIESLGFSALMVHEPLGYNGYRAVWPNDIISMQFAKRVAYNHTEQEHYSKLPLLNEVAETFVVGSDQLWNPLIGRVNDDLFLDFVGQENRRVAYATSFGNRGIEKFKPEFIEKHTENLKKFDAISVREGYAINTAKNVFDVEATLVVDPVFLLPQASYDTLAEQATAKVTGEYLAVFFLDPTPEKKAVAEAVADKLGLTKIVVIPNPDGGRKLVAQIFQGDRFEILAEDCPENFLYTYSKARYVVTDSFHGSAFAAIFQKPFSSIYNTRRGADRFKNLMAALGFGESRRIFETDSAEKIRANQNVALDCDFSKAIDYIETGRKMSLQWLKAALSPKSARPGGLGILGVVKEKYQALRPTSAMQKTNIDLIDQPNFTANTAAWRIAPLKKATGLTVTPGAAVKGNLVWCDLPFPLLKQAAYRLTIKWAVRTTATAVNLHIRNEQTGKFRVIGTVAIKQRVNVLRSDTIDFVASEDDFTQFMLGALHFSGENAGAEISSIAVQEIPVASIKSVTPLKGPSLADKAMEMALHDNARFVTALTKGTASNDIGGARARMMFHAHAIEKGLSRETDFRAGFGRISVPGLAKEMNRWLMAGRDIQDQFFCTAASVMRAYFDRHKQLNVDVAAFWHLFDTPVQGLIEKADGSHGGVLAAASERETKIESNQDRDFLDVLYGRRSVREFTSIPVQDADVQRAVQIAMQAPSVCNRQAARVHQFDDPRAIKAAIDLQGGFGGYELPPKLLLVTCDLTAFLFTSERNQPFIDGGLFMMTLLLGLEQVGLGACSLNTAMNPERENAIRRNLNIPENEIFIAFIAVGHFDPAVLTPQSKRITVDEVLVRH